MLNKRMHTSEALDNLELSGPTLYRALDGLSSINRYLGNTSSTLKQIITELKYLGGEKLVIVDLGCGGGDNLRAIGEWSIKKGLHLDLIGIEGNKNSILYAKEKNTEEVRIEYLHADILDTSFSVPACDILISSHFVYHFSDEALVRFLQKAKQQVRKRIIFSELQRSVVPYVLFNLLAFLLPFDAMVKADGLKAIQRAFTKSELKIILEKAGLKTARVKWKWAFRYLVTIPLI